MTTTTATPTGRKNVYAGRCVTCGFMLRPGTGETLLRSDGRYVVRHLNGDACATVVRTREARAAIVVTVPAAGWERDWDAGTGRFR